MRAKTIAAVLASAAIAGLALPAGAAAKPGYFKVPAQYSEVIQMRTSGGYRFALQVFGRRATASFDKSVLHHGIELLTYSLRHRLARGPDLHFRLGRHGEIDLRFVPDRREVQKDRGCTGGQSVTEPGHFVGTLRVRAQHGVDGVDVHRVAGFVSREPPLVCRRIKPKRGIVTVGLPAHPGAHPPVAEGALELIAGVPADRLRFVALRSEEEPETIGSTPFIEFYASVTRREGDLTMTSLASAAGFDQGFVSPEPEEPLSAATISPAAPFSGEASLR